MTKAARAYDIIRGVFGDGIKFIKKSIRKDLPELKSTKIVKPTIKRNSTEFYKSKTLQEKGYEASKNIYGKPGVSVFNNEQLAQAVKIEKHKRSMGM